MQSAPGWPSSPRTVSPARWPPGGRRDEVIFRLLLDTGVRVSELCGLKLEDVDLDRELAYVAGKGSRPRVVPFGAKTGRRSTATRGSARCTRRPAHRGRCWACAVR